MYTVRLIMVFLLEGRRQKTPWAFRSLLVIFVTQDLRAPPSPLPLPSLPALPWHVECCLRARPHALARPLASRQGQGGGGRRAAAAAGRTRHGRRDQAYWRAGKGPRVLGGQGGWGVVGRAWGV